MKTRNEGIFEVCPKVQWIDDQYKSRKEIKEQEMENQGTKRKEPIDKPIQREDKDKEIKIWAWKRFCFHSQGLPVLCSKLVETNLNRG